MKKFNESPEDMMPASPDEKSMAMRQAKFIEYVAEEIEEYLENNRAFPEWMQNKLTALHEKAKDMHAVMAGDYEDDEDDEDEMEEAKSYGPGHIGAIQRMLDKERAAKKYTKPTQAEIDADRKKDQRGKSRASVTAKSVTNKQYAGLLGGLRKEEVELSESYINEKLSVSQGMGAWIDDFKKSDAPQFKGKSDKERRDMAIAAYLSAKRGQQK